MLVGRLIQGKGWKLLFFEERHDCVWGGDWICCFGCLFVDVKVCEGALVGCFDTPHKIRLDIERIQNGILSHRHLLSAATNSTLLPLVA